MVIKTRAERMGALRAAFAELHPYDVPELVALEISDGLEPYLEWLDENVS
jgi:periplasmic divalent cation tolerance protein